MAKYSKDVDQTLAERVQKLAEKYDVFNQDIRVEVLRLNKIGKDIGEIVKGNDLVKLFAGKDVVAIALAEEIFDQVDDETKDIWIEGLLTQIYYDQEKEKLTITKPEINISIGMYNKYGDVAIQKEVLAQIALEQFREKEKERKEQEKLSKKEKH